MHPRRPVLGAHSGDTSGVPRARRLEVATEFYRDAGFGVVDVIKPRGQEGDHLLIGSTFVGVRSAFGFIRVEDPVARTAAPVDAADATLGLQIVPASAVTVVAGGGHQHHDAGELFLTRHREPIEHQTFERSSLLALRLSRSLLTLGDPELDRAVNGDLRFEDWHRSLLLGTASVIPRMAATALLPGGAIALDHYIAGIFELILRSALSLPARTPIAGRSPAERATAVRRHIQQNLLDPDLAATTIAAHFHLSVRQLNRSFDPGDGLAEQIHTARLDYARTLLLDPALAHVDIADIAALARCGTPATFSRAFTARFGRTPRKVRGDVVWAGSQVVAPNL